MNFQDAVKAHQDWKTKLYTYLATPDASLKPEVVGVDNNCALGKWIYSEGAAFASLPEYVQLKSFHAKFHQCAGGIIAKINEGKLAEAEKALKAGGDYMNLSTEVVSLIRRIQEKVEKK